MPNWTEHPKGNLEEVPESVKDLLRLSRGALEMFEATQRQLLDRLRKELRLGERVAVLESIRGVGEVTALTWALEICDPQRFRSIADAESYCGLTSALDCSADTQHRGPIRNRATLAVARKLVAYLLAVDKSGQPFRIRNQPAPTTEVATAA